MTPAEGWKEASRAARPTPTIFRESANYAVLETMNGLLEWKNHTDASSRHAGFQRKGPAEPGMEGRGPSLQDNLPGRQPP